jgi:hypothetical protein
VGLSRLLVSAQAFLGLALAGVAVARITSTHGRTVRLVAFKAGGEWIELWNAPKTGDSMISLSAIYYDGEKLNYDGANYAVDGTPKGFFRGHMIDFHGSYFRFTYSNTNSATEYFEEGLCDLQFQGMDKDGRWECYQGTTHDFGKKETIVYEGFRASLEQAKRLRNSNRSERARFTKEILNELASQSILPTVKADRDV